MSFAKLFLGLLNRHRKPKPVVPPPPPPREANDDWLRPGSPW